MATEQHELQIIEKAGGKIVEVHVSGKLDEAAYEQFTPQIESLIKRHGKIRMLLYLHDFQGWTASALWEDLKFDWKHFSDIERLAMVGESKWQAGMATFCKPFTTAEIKYFNHDHLAEARQWIESN